MSPCSIAAGIFLLSGSEGSLQPMQDNEAEEAFCVTQNSTQSTPIAAAVVHMTCLDICLLGSLPPQELFCLLVWKTDRPTHIVP
jgi:hypothetical protein